YRRRTQPQPGRAHEGKRHGLRQGCPLGPAWPIERTKDFLSAMTDERNCQSQPQRNRRPGSACLCEPAKHDRYLLIEMCLERSKYKSLPPESRAANAEGSDNSVSRSNITQKSSWKILEIECSG